MAIQKSKALPNGTSGDYWKIITISMDRIGGNTSYRLALFYDQAHGQALVKVPLSIVKEFSFVLTSSERDGDLIALGYTKIIAQAETLVPPLGDPLGTPVYFDADIAGGTVL